MHHSDLKNLDVAIVGAGYGGAAAAKALSLLGANVAVYEQASETREVGAGIGLRPSTMDLFRRWGIFDAIAAVSSPSDYFEILTPTGEPIMKDAWPGMDDYGVKTHTHLIHRGDFIEALLGVLPDGMVRLGHKLETIEDHGDSATLSFANGTSVTADLVIGADGIRSVVREQLFSQAGPVFSGEHAYRTVLDADDAYGTVIDDNLRMYIGRGTKVYLLPLRHRGQVSFDVTSLNADPTWSPQVTKDDLLATLEGFDERLVSMARDLDLATCNVRAVYDIDPFERWHTDAVALLGDSAHSMLHHQGQGANSAILDAGALATALVESDSVAAALTAYQAVRKPVTDELQAISRQGWEEDALDDVFPGQKPASQKAATPQTAR
ncbi:salicylate hydroxylase [Mumia flava]|uniref:Salicylate hydroxylase n=1 Tax=Mumia flava TaxID=1348852 RepID=A0A0B2B5C4_9ACTN|nr:NAD(P)/FAD-dependent oxidoreductase [Mumia flava]PJJ54308.1 salicylate hydroxylase [Mumia flava]